MVIRRASRRDWDWIVSLAASVYDDLGDYGKIIPSWLEHPGVLSYLDESSADTDGSLRLRGFILLGFYQPPGEAGGSYVADLLAIAVHPGHRRLGVGRELLEFAIQVATRASRTAECPEIRLTVAHTNQIGQHLFSSSGFKVLDANHGSYDGGQRAIRMARSLR
jgi:ribosomal protein S18 acetylase RimI-like enzyme